MKMTTADWALVISICSAALSLFALIWNVWSKFIYPKPKLIVTFTQQSILDKSGLRDPFLNLSITNHGPLPDIITHSIVQLDNGLFRKRGLALLQPLSNFPIDFKRTQGPFSGGLPKKIEVGEEFSLKYWYGENWLDENVLRVGVIDSFGRMHRCRRRDVKTVKTIYLKDKADGRLAKGYYLEKSDDE